MHSSCPYAQVRPQSFLMTEGGPYVPSGVAREDRAGKETGIGSNHLVLLTGTWRPEGPTCHPLSDEECRLNGGRRNEFNPYKPATLRGRCYYPHCTHKDTGAQGDAGATTWCSHCAMVPHAWHTFSSLTPQPSGGGHH